MAKLFQMASQPKEKCYFCTKFLIMLQRIQTVYLLISAILMAVVTFTGNVVFTTSDAVYTLAFNGVVKGADASMVYTTWPLIALSLLSATLAFFSVFMYKKRMIQIRISIFNLVLMIGYIPMLVYYIMDINKELSTTSSYKVPIVFPLIAAILTFLSIRAIGKDEALVRSLDRIR